MKTLGQAGLWRRLLPRGLDGAISEWVVAGGMGRLTEQLTPFVRNRKSPVGCPERSRARVLCAAKRTLDGEDSRRTMDDERTG